ncbi:MAG: hypothetical protein U0871_15585 [Gemmataceae bacterium]
MNPPKYTLPSFELVPEPLLSFHPDRMKDVDVHPLRGLLSYGPYSRKMPLSAPDPVRIAVVCPERTLGNAQNLLYELQCRQPPRERKAYLVDYDGFSKVYGVGLDCPQNEKDPRVVLLGESEASQAIGGLTPQDKFAELVFSALRRLAPVRSQFDVVLLYLPDRWSIGYKSPTDDESSDFDLHDSVKAVSSALHMPVQVLNDQVMSYTCRCSVAWRLSLALYTKAGGVPWKMAGFEDRHAYVGLGYCLRKGTDRKFVTCCSQIFDAQGTNLQFLLYESRAGGYEGDNPFLPRSDMHRVMARTLSLYQDQKGQPPTRVVVHKTTHFTRDEVDGCLEALATVDDVELLTLSQTTAWQGVKIDAPKTKGVEKGEAAPYPLERGIAMPLGVYDFLLWTQGTCPAVGANYFKEGKGIPHPIRVTRHVGGGTFHESSREILGLSKMNWNNDSLYDRMPVTTSYASILAGIVKRMGPLSSLPYDFRYFM